MHLTDSAGCTALQRSAENGQVEMVRFLLKAGANVDGTGAFQATPLMCALACGHTNVAQFLLEAGASVNCYDQQGQSPLHTACWRGNVNMARRLIDAGASLNVIDKDGYTAFNFACKGFQAGLARMLINWGDVQPFIPLDAFYRDRVRRSPYENTEGLDSVVHSLLDAGVQPPHSFMSKQLSSAVRQVLKQAGLTTSDEAQESAMPSNMSAKEKMELAEKTGLRAAAEKGDITMVQMLILAGTDVNNTDWMWRHLKQTPLMSASCLGHDKIVRALLDAGAKVDTTESGDNRTELLLASSFGHTTVAQMLIKSGANGPASSGPATSGRASCRGSGSSGTC